MKPEPYVHETPKSKVSIDWHILFMPVAYCLGVIILLGMLSMVIISAIDYRTMHQSVAETIEQSQSNVPVKSPYKYEVRMYSICGDMNRNIYHRHLISIDTTEIVPASWIKDTAHYKISLIP